MEEGKIEKWEMTKKRVEENKGRSNKEDIPDISKEDKIGLKVFLWRVNKFYLIGKSEGIYFREQTISYVMFIW